MKKFRKVMKVIGKGILILIVILAVAHAIASAILSRKLEAKIAEIRASGDPVSTIELGKIDVPDSENAANVYLQIFDRMGTPITYRNGVPRFGPSREVGPERLKLYKARFPARTDGKRTPEMWDRARKSLAAYGEVFGLTDRAISMPDCNFRTNWKDGPDVQFPYFACMRQLSRLCSVSALVHARDGNIDAGVRDASRIFGIARSIRNEPSLIGQLVRIAILSMGMQCVRDISANGLSASQAGILDRALSDIGIRDGFAVGMKGERAYAITSFRMLLSGREIGLTDRNLGQKLSFPVRAGLYIGRPFLYADMISGIDLESKYVSDTIGPAMFRDYPVAVRRYPEAPPEDPSAGGMFSYLSAMFHPVFTGAMRSRDLCEASTLSCRIMLQLIEYKHRFGAYPLSLGALGSQLKVGVPVDPMSGKEFHYGRQGNGFLLYGVGPNMRDDGGKFNPRWMFAGPHGKDYDDIVWAMPK